MPPRRRNRANVTDASTPAADEDVDTPTEQHKGSASPEQSTYDPLKDPWTTEQEITLFKGIIKCKPSGMHKHFRMIALAEHLRSQGWDPKTYEHTRIPAIWEKLSTLYNLDAIDEIDNSLDYTDEETGEEQWLEFSLPEDEYGEAMWMRGINESGNSSPAQLNRSPSPPASKKRKRDAPSKGRASTIDDTDEPQTSPVASPVVKASRSSRGRTRMSKAEESKETTVDTDDQEMDEEDEEEEQDEEEEDEGTPTARSFRGSVRSAKGRTTGRAQSSTRKSNRIRK